MRACRKLLYSGACMCYIYSQCMYIPIYIYLYVSLKMTTHQYYDCDNAFYEGTDCERIRTPAGYPSY